MAALTLPDAPWRAREGMEPLLEALDAATGQSRFVGGAVRDTLLGMPVQDVDIATRLRPEDVIDRLRAGGIKAIPTGIAHGTITAILPDGPIEITTLRRDVSTDGRRATVAFSDDWREDAARRDFTINALYADPQDGGIVDYFDGLEDLKAGRIRFIGDPLQRIAEDHLRILRFFRFHARFGKGDPDGAALAACSARARDLMALSRERIADELLKLLALPDPLPVIEIMVGSGILGAVLPEMGQASLERLARLCANEHTVKADPDALRRLIALLPRNPGDADGIAARLKLSNAQRKRITTALTRMEDEAKEIFYRWGAASAIDRLLLSDSSGNALDVQIGAILDGERPALPISGGALVERGLVAGPIVAKALQTVERRWIDEGFPDAARVDAIADEVVDQLLRAQK